MMNHFVEHRDTERLYSEIGKLKLKMELDWLRKSPGSVRHVSTVVGESELGALGGAPVLTGRRKTLDRIRTQPACHY